MQIILNKRLEIIPDKISIKDLLEFFNIDSKYMAVEVNNSIVPKSEYSNFSLEEKFFIHNRPKVSGKQEIIDFFSTKDVNSSALLRSRI